MFTYHTGIKQAPAAAEAYAAYLTESSGVVPEQLEAAEYYLRTVGAAEAVARGMSAVPRLRGDVDPGLAKALGLEPGQLIGTRRLANVLAGYAADGGDLPGSQHDVRAYRPRGIGDNGGPAPDDDEGEPAKERHRIAYYDFTLSAPKSVSLAWAFAGTDAERASILQCHHIARDEALRYVEREIARAHLGRSREGGIEAATFAWITVDHFAARPTVAVERPDPETGVVATELYQVPAGNGLLPGDPQLHTHCIVPNLMRTESGRFVAINGNLLRDRVHEFGAVYQAVLARELRRMGVDVELCARTKAAKLPCVPQAAVDEFSKRTKDAEATARRHFEEAHPGQSWDALAPDAKVAFLKGGAGASRRSKVDDLEQVAAWVAQAARIGWKHATAIAFGPTMKPRTREERLDAALGAADPLFAEELGRRAVVKGTDARLAFARGLIAEGIESTDEVSAGTRAMVRRGVVQDGRLTRLKWVEENGRSTKLTTELHEAQERELIALARKAAADHRHDLPRERVDEAAARAGIGFTGKIGPLQRAAAHAMAGCGAVGAFVGAAGVGKTSRVLPPLVCAWAEEGRDVWGVALAWRQARALGDAGVAPFRQRALQPFLDGVASGETRLTDRSVVVVDELSLVGTRQLLDLLRHRDRIGFKLVLTGDERQCQAVEAGPTIELLRRALGDKAIPEILTTIRQEAEAERARSLLFRQGRAGEALATKRQDGTAELVAGGYSAVARRVAELATERRRANAHDPGYRVTISAPTNMDAHMIGLAVRKLRREAGEITGPDAVKAATDGAGNAYDLPLAVGDRVRLFAVTRAEFTDERGRKKTAQIGDNGSVRDVVAVEAGGLRLRNPDTGKVGLVTWEALTVKGSGRIKLALGEALTVNTSQGDTADEHLFAMPAGSAAVHGFLAYVGASRHRLRSYVVGSVAAEMRELAARRPSGVEAPTGPEAVEAAWRNLAANLARQPPKESAVAFLEGATAAATKAAQGLQAGLRVHEAREKAGQPRTTLRSTFDHAQAKAALAALVTRMEEAMRKRAPLIERLQASAAKVSPPAPARPEARAPNRAERRRATRRVKVSEADAAAQLKAAMERHGLRPRGTPILDGQLRYVDAVDSRGKLAKKAGAYRAKYEGIVPAGAIFNWKRGGFVGTWKADGEVVAMTDAEIREMAEKAAKKAARQARETAARQEAAAQKAAWILEGAGPADPRHPYLVAKEVEPHGIRQDLNGNLVVPLHDIRTGRLRNLQTIAPDGSKLYLAGAQKSGSAYLVGQLGAEGSALGAAEGFATAATVHEETGRPVAMVLDTSNLGPAVRALHAAYPTRPLFNAADNDHHLPVRENPLPNAGKEKAEKAAEETGARVLLAPELPERAAVKKGTDWNDFRAIRGRAATKAALQAAWAAKNPAPAMVPAAVAARARAQRHGPRARM